MLDSMDDTKVTLPENKWDQILGVHHVSNVFKLHRLTAESERAVKNAIEGGAAQPDELFKISDEAKKWCFPDIEKRVSTRLQELLLNPDAPDTTLATTSLETLSSIVESLEPAAHFALVRRYIEVRAAAKDPVPLEANARLWARVPFSSLAAADLESAYSDPNVPSGAVVEATVHALIHDPSQATGLSYNLLSAALDQAAASGPYMSQSQIYKIVRAYNSAHTDLDEPKKDKLWNRVKFVELGVEELEDAYSSTDVPRAPVVAAMFSRLRHGAAPSPSASPIPPSNPTPTPATHYDINKPTPAPPVAQGNMYGHRTSPSYDYGSPGGYAPATSATGYSQSSMTGYAPSVPAPAGLGQGSMGFDIYTATPAGGMMGMGMAGEVRKSEEKKRFGF
ncbi:hypothetical protein HDU93_005022 [Gonapodya sp. JEL0774]|nr:hypothetical protein HDU93_005022 [Gonapodya sp. JEL0774]